MIEQDQHAPGSVHAPENESEGNKQQDNKEGLRGVHTPSEASPISGTHEGGVSHHGGTTSSGVQTGEGRPIERAKGPGRTGARGTAAMDPQTRKEVARKGGLAVSRNKQHMAEIGRKGGQSVSKNREHMAQIGRKGGAASRGHR